MEFKYLIKKKRNNTFKSYFYHEVLKKEIKSFHINK